MRFLFVSILLHSFSIFATSEKTLLFQSSNTKINLLELYTSEGCSSCPPAEAWLSTFKNDRRLWTEIIPIAFHVTYWDRLGWADAFASPVYTNRQYRYHEAGHTKNVYTPGFFLNGEEWKKWFRKKDLQLPQTSNAGKLSLTISQENILVQFIPLSKMRNDLDVHIVSLGFGVKSEVTKGENRNKVLHYDFIATGFLQQTMVQENDIFSLRIERPSFLMNNNKKGAIAAWVTFENNMPPIQAVGGWL